MGKKALFLFLGLGLPILVFLFLKTFGKNEFDVPYPELPTSSECGKSISPPYIVPDSTLNYFAAGSFNLLVLNFGPYSKKLERIVDRPRVTFISESDALLGSLTPSRSEFIKRCELLIQEPANLVLIDDKHVIRGVYDVADRDELDRLEAEIKILLKEY